MATFFIEIDKEHYTAGETITGNVLVDVPNTINNTEGLILTFTGYRQSKWHEVT